MNDPGPSKEAMDVILLNTNAPPNEVTDLALAVDRFARARVEEAVRRCYKIAQDAPSGCAAIRIQEAFNLGAK